MKRTIRYWFFSSSFAGDSNSANVDMKRAIDVIMEWSSATNASRKWARDKYFEYDIV